MDAACRHTRISHDQVRAFANRIKADLMALGVREIASRELGEIAMQYLKEIDVVAYIRFACVYKRFKDIHEVVEAIRSIAPQSELNEEKHATEKK